MYLMPQSQPTSGKAKFNAGDKGEEFFFLMGSFDEFLRPSIDLPVPEPHYWKGDRVEEAMAKRNEAQILDSSLLHNSADDCPATEAPVTSPRPHTRTHTHVNMLN